MNIKKAVCECGHIFTPKKGRNAICQHIVSKQEKNKLAMRQKRLFESEDDTLKRKQQDALTCTCVYRKIIK